MSYFAENFASLPASAAPAKARVATQFNRLLSVVRAYLQARAGRKAMYALAQMDDHFLKDIGVTRADVGAALLAAPETDPSLVLRERRAAALYDSRALKSEVLREISK